MSFPRSTSDLQIVVYSATNHCKPAYFIITISIIEESKKLYEPVHEISNNVVCATSKGSDQPAHTRSLIRAFASRLSIL